MSLGSYFTLKIEKNLQTTLGQTSLGEDKSRNSHVMEGSYSYPRKWTSEAHLKLTKSQGLRELADPSNEVSTFSLCSTRRGAFITNEGWPNCLKTRRVPHARPRQTRTWKNRSLQDPPQQRWCFPTLDLHSIYGNYTKLYSITTIKDINKPNTIIDENI